MEGSASCIIEFIKLMGETSELPNLGYCYIFCKANSNQKNYGEPDNAPGFVLLAQNLHNRQYNNIIDQ